MTAALATRPTSKRGSVTKPLRRYDLKDAFFDAAIKDAIYASLYSPISLGEKHDVRLKPGFDTACWAYLPPHKIFVGTDLFEKRLVKLGLTETQQKKYIANHYHHELGHALFTERDMARIQAQLKAIDAQFSIYNLFEDAYMESRYHREAEYKFEWLELEHLDFNPRPESLLFALIQAEGDAEIVGAGLKVWDPVKSTKDSIGFAALSMLMAPSKEDALSELQSLLPKVIEYYKRIIGVKHSMRLIPILRDWLDEFGRPPEMPSRGMADVHLSAEMMANASFATTFSLQTKPVSAAVAPLSLEGPGKPKKTVIEDSIAAIAKKGRLLGKDSTKVDAPRAELLAKRFQKLFNANTRYASTSVPQKRMSVKHFTIGRPFYRRKEVRGVGPKKIFLVIDCSGSMRGFHIMEGKLLLTALNLLARQGLVIGHVVLSGVVERDARYELFRLPMKQGLIDQIQGFAGAEGLEYTLRENLNYAKEADHVFVYTDGQICDKAIDKSYFHKQGIYTWGLYAGDDQSFLEELIEYFDKAIMRQSAEDLIDAILAQLK